MEKLGSEVTHKLNLSDAPSSGSSYVMVPDKEDIEFVDHMGCSQNETIKALLDKDEKVIFSCAVEK